MRRILVVDDDLHTRVAIRTWLQRGGFRVAIADGGTAGRNGAIGYFEG
jgi:CheY-like chemotaxis protein